MRGQMTIFDFIDAVQVVPGQWIREESGLIGREMTFDEIAESVGQLIVMDKSTQSLKGYKVVLVEKIVTNGEQRRLIYYDGVKQRGLVDEMYFSKDYPFSRAKAYKLNI